MPWVPIEPHFNPGLIEELLHLISNFNFTFLSGALTIVEKRGYVHGSERIVRTKNRFKYKNIAYMYVISIKVVVVF